MISEGDWTQAERQIAQAAVTGGWVDLSSGKNAKEDPAKGAMWSRHRTIRAEFLVDLLTGTRKLENGSLRAVKLSGARIVGALGLDYSTVTCPLLLQFCYFDEPIDLVRADATIVNFHGSHVPHIDASDLRTSRDLVLTGLRCAQVSLLGAQIGGDVNLQAATLTGRQGVALLADQMQIAKNLLCRDGFTAGGAVRLSGARVGGRVVLDDATLTNPGGRAFEGEGLAIAWGLSGKRLTVEGETWLHGARIGGDLVLNDAKLTNPDGRALSAVQLEVTQSMSCGYGFSASGQVLLAAAQIGGQLDLTAATLTNPQRTALEASGLKAGQGMICQGLTTQGEMVVGGAHIGAQFILDGAKLVNQTGNALQADGVTVTGSMFGEGFSAQGEVRMINAHIGGSLHLRGASLSNPGGYALNADRLTVDYNVHCTKGFLAVGEVRIPSATISGWLYLNGSRISNPNGRALAADQIVVRESLDGSGGFSADGEVRLHGAHIGSQLNLASATLNNPEGPALGAHRLTVDMDVILRGGFTAAGEVILNGSNIGGALDLHEAKLMGSNGSTIDLTDAQIGVLVWRPDECRNGTVNLSHTRVRILDDDHTSWPTEFTLDGFVYESLNNSNDVRTRLRWLKSSRDGYTPQIYDQLAAVYRRAGDDNSARTVAIAQQWRRRSELHPLGKAWNWLLYATVGYGYRTWLAAIWLSTLVAVGSWTFDHTTMRPIAGTSPAFNPVAYTLDVLLPIVDLGQEKAWHPTGAAQYWVWALIVAGWGLTTAVVAGLTKLLKRE